MTGPRVEILAVGTEILTGEVQDTNTRLLARTVTGLGGTVVLAAVLPDDPATLREWIRASLGRAPRVLFTGGGLGPTADDGTLAAVAAAAEAPLEEHAEALGMVRATYARLASSGAVDDAALTPERAKMARLPRGARAVANPVGAAPACVLQAGGTTIVSLPGVPEELEGIVAGPLRPVLEGIFGASVHLLEEVVVATGDESALAPAVDRVGEAFPAVRVKSRARKFGGRRGIRVTLSARGDREEEVRDLLRRCRAELVRACAARGLGVGERSEENGHGGDRRDDPAAGDGAGEGPQAG